MRSFFAAVLFSLLLLAGICAPLTHQPNTALIPLRGEENIQNFNLQTPDSDTSPQSADTLELSAPSAILMEASTGTILYEKAGTTQLAPASVTKIMSMLLIFEALSAGNIQLTDEVTISEHAAGMGGSQVFLEPGELQTVETLLKCISIASANDAVVAMAEYVSGSEEAFVRKMNEKAASLHMEHTNFVNCCGLDDPNHYTCANDIAVMSRELITKYPQVFDYCNIWQEDITHTTKKGTFPFTLSNTNKLLKQYPYATGLKTGSTSQAKFCLSATASKDNMTLIAVVMAAENSKLRFADATKLLEYGFSTTSIYEDKMKGHTYEIPVKKGVKDSLTAECTGDFHYLSKTGENMAGIEKKTDLPKNLTAPIKKGDVVGQITYRLGEKTLGSLPLEASEDIRKAGFSDYYQKMLKQFFCHSSK